MTSRTSPVAGAGCTWASSPACTSEPESKRGGFYSSPVCVSDSARFAFVRSESGRVLRCSPCLHFTISGSRPSPRALRGLRCTERSNGGMLPALRCPSRRCFTLHLQNGPSMYRPQGTIVDRCSHLQIPDWERQSVRTMGNPPKAAPLSPWKANR